MNSTERHEARYQRRKAARIEKKAKALKEFGDFGYAITASSLHYQSRLSTTMAQACPEKAMTSPYPA